MNNLQKKIRSRKLLLGVVTGLAAVSVASVGFSSWILGDQTYSDSTGDISVGVGALTDNRMGIEIVNVSNVTDYSLAFDDDGYQGDVVKGSSTEAAPNEDLKFTVVVNVTSEATPIKDLLSGFSISIGSNAMLQQLISGGIIQSPVTSDGGSLSWLSSTDVAAIFAETPVLTGSKAYTNPSSIYTYTWSVCDQAGADVTTVVSTALSMYFKVTFSFAWGSAFDYANPTRMSQTTFDSGGSTALSTLATWHSATAAERQLSATITATAVSTSS